MTNLNLQIYWVLNEIADLLEIKGENIYRVRAYRKGARAIKNYRGDIEDLYQSNKLQTINGVGKGISDVISEIITTGKSSLLDELRQEVPPSLRKMMYLPGLGPKLIRTIYTKLGVVSLEELEKAAKAKKIRRLPRLGSKTELTILRGIVLLKSHIDKTLIGIALPVAEYFKEQLESLSEVKKVSITGGLRRGLETLESADLLVATYEPHKVGNIIKNNSYVQEVLNNTDDRISLLTWSEVKLDILFVEPDYFYEELFLSTGSELHIKELLEFARKKNIDINKNGIYRINNSINEKIKINSEKDIYQKLQIQFIPPEIREGKGEVRLASDNKLPKLVTKGDIKGDLHIHSDWSDGLNKIQDIIKAAKDKGYNYIAITDHSASLKIAGGLPIERLLEQHEYIRRLSESNNFRIFTGTEVDIQPDGTLDYPDDLLEKIDIVIASIHTHMKMSYEKMTDRIISALENPNVDILAHPTGRILGKRQPYQVDIEEIIKVAARTKTALEINSSPDRLDLKDEHVSIAKRYGAFFAINTDAHVIQSMSDIDYGVKVARRAGLTKEDIINCWNTNDILRWLNIKS